MPFVVLRPPAHPEAPAQPCGGPRWGGLPGSGEAVGGARKVEPVLLLRRGLRLRAGGPAGTCRSRSVSAALGFGRPWGPRTAEPSKLDSSGPIFLSRGAPSLVSPEGPAALLRRCSAWGEKQSWGAPRGTLSPGGGVVECSEPRPSVSLILSLPPSLPPTPTPRLPQGAAPGATWRVRGVRGPVTGGREGKSERPGEREV